MFKGFFSKRSPREAAYYGAVIDTSNDTVVAIRTFVPALRLLSETMMDVTFAPYISSQALKNVQLTQPRTFPEWSWNWRTRTFYRTNPAVVTEELRERAVFANKKAAILEQAMYSINRLRMKVQTGFSFQDTLYAEKKRQAQALKDADFTDAAAEKAPYVLQYAEVYSISPKAAAEEIVLQAQLDDDLLLRSERLRLLLFKKIKAAATAQELDEVWKAYRTTGLV